MAAQSGVSAKLAAALFFGAAVAVIGGGYLLKDDNERPLIEAFLSPAIEKPQSSKEGDETAPAIAEQEEADKPAVAEQSEGGEAGSKPVEQDAEIAALAADEAHSQTKAPAVNEEVITPSFDILRVERDGSVVVAGRAPANSDVEIIGNGEALAMGKAGSGGEFAIVFDTPLAPGLHELTIRATPPVGEGEIAAPVYSAEVGIITIPEKGGDDGQLMAMVQENGKATRILQQPAAPENTEVKQPQKETAPEAETTAAISIDEKVEKSPEAKVVEETNPEGSKPVNTGRSEPVIVQAIDVEEDVMFIAGVATPGKQVRIYINGQFKGSASVAANGGFLVELKEGLKPGKHDLRVDQVEGASGNVISRVAVVIDHESEKSTPPLAALEPKAELPPAGEVLSDRVLSGKISSRAGNQPESMAKAEGNALSGSKAEPTGRLEKPKPALAAEAAGEPAKPSIAELAEAKSELNPATQETGLSQAETGSTTEAAQTAQAGQPVVIKTGRSVIIRRGDSLWRISRRMLGKGHRYTMIFEANANQIKDPDKIYPGQVFDVPYKGKSKVESTEG